MQELYEKIKLCKLGNKKVLQEVVNSFEKTIMIELFKFKKENSDIFMNEYDFQDKKSEITLNVLNAIKNMPIESFEYKTDYSVKKYIRKTILNRLNEIKTKEFNKTENEYKYEFDFSFCMSSDFNAPNKYIFVNDLIEKIKKKEK